MGWGTARVTTGVFGVIDIIGACGEGVEEREKAATPKKNVQMELRKDELEMIHQVLAADTTENRRSLDRAGPTRFF